MYSALSYQAADNLTVCRGPVAAGVAAPEPDPVAPVVDVLRLDVDPAPADRQLEQHVERDGLLAARLRLYADPDFSLAGMVRREPTIPFVGGSDPERRGQVHYGEKLIEAARVIARKSVMSSMPSAGLKATVRSPSRSIVGTRAA